MTIRWRWHVGFAVQGLETLDDAALGRWISQRPVPVGIFGVVNLDVPQAQAPASILRSKGRIQDCSAALGSHRIWTTSGRTFGKTFILATGQEAECRIDALPPIEGSTLATRAIPAAVVVHTLTACCFFTTPIIARTIRFMTIAILPLTIFANFLVHALVIASKTFRLPLLPRVLDNPITRSPRIRIRIDTWKAKWQF